MSAKLASMRIPTLIQQLRRINDGNPEKAAVHVLEPDIDEDELLDAMELEFPRPDYAVSIMRKGLQRWAYVKKVVR